ncbi:hypothetical protein A2U01_0022075, partial [Trifolium medium]|nr:hypothetical protein [Trifolium medium]
MEKKINLVDLLFGYLCQAIRDSFNKNTTIVIYPRLLSELFYQTKLVQIFKKAHPELVEEERAKKLDEGFLTKMHLKKKVVKPQNPLKAQFEEHLFIDGFPIISEADDEEVILNFLEDLLRSTGVFVPRSMVPPAPNTDLYKPRKRKQKTSEEEEEPKKKKGKKHVATTSKDVEEKVVEEKVVQKEAVVAEKVKKKDLKRKSSGIKIDEERAKMRHNKRSKEDESSTESDDVPLAQRLKQK